MPDHNDNLSNHSKMTDTPAQPIMTFAEVAAAVSRVDGLTEGVRANIVSAVARVASLVSPVAGTAAVVNINAVAKKLDKVMPAQLGFKAKGSMATMKSNFRRGLDIAGFTTMPGRHTTKLAPSWADLLARLDEKLARNLTRFAHVATEQGWGPVDISDAHIERFRVLLETTCLRSKMKKTVRSTIRAWNCAEATIGGWPSTKLNTGRSDDWYYGFDWAAFPATFQADVDAFLDRGATTADFLEADDGLPPLKARTRANYKEGFRRAASILVRSGIAPEEIKGIAALVPQKRAKTILEFLRNRLRRTDGGQVGFIAMLLYIAARDWVYRDGEPAAEEDTVATLEFYFKKTKLKRKGMSERTQGRLSQFDDPHVQRDYLNTPRTLMARARTMAIDSESARLVRLALYIAVSLDTLLRIGNIVGLNLYEHFRADGKGKGRKLFVTMPDTAVKNSVAFYGALRPSTIEIFDAYVGHYRKLHDTGNSPWLFPGSGGNHWQERDARNALNDYCSKHLGIDMTPHVHRSLGGKIILDANPGAHHDVKDNLGHKRLSTSTTYYIARSASETRARYHRVLERCQKGIDRGND